MKPLSLVIHTECQWRGRHYNDISKLGYVQWNEQALLLLDNLLSVATILEARRGNNTTFHLYLTNSVVRSKNRNRWEMPFSGISPSCSGGARNWNVDHPYGTSSPVGRDSRHERWNSVKGQLQLRKLKRCWSTVPEVRLRVQVVCFMRFTTVCQKCSRDCRALRRFTAERVNCQFCELGQ